MKCGIPNRLCSLLIGTALLSTAASIATLRKHTLTGGTLNPLSNDLVNRLNGTKAGTCSLFSCLGARKWEQRKCIQDAFKLDPQQSAKFSGALKPRCDLWELQQPEHCTLVLDVDIPPTEDDLGSTYDRRKVVQMCQRSSVVLLHLNREDIRHTGKSFLLSRPARDLLKDLAKSNQRGTIPDVYVFLPELGTLKQKYTREDVTAYEHFKTHLSDLVNKNTKFHFKSHRDEPSVYRTVVNLGTSSSPKDIARTISMAPNDNAAVKNSAAVQIRDACFGPHRVFLKDRLAEIYRGSMQPVFTKSVESSMIDAALSLHLRTRDLHADDIVSHFIDQEYKQMSLFTGDAYLRLVMLSAAEAKCKLRKELGDNPKQDTDALVESILSDHDIKLAQAMESVSTKMSPPSWIVDTAKEIRSQLREHLDAIVAVHKGVPSPTYAKQERSIEENYAKQKKKRGVSTMLSVSCMLRERGYGNRQGYLNYQWGPLILTLGYANDRDIAESKPGTGLVTPAFRIQPRLHVNVSL
ncbi:hypothetical protein BaOVIS_000250 [Babesia ovis]|uniref:Uncharacterized protein n=1 Tax=Babesia ovis TaxID=5869 RepID=A0A9W5T7X1_BABOV|nr:hypothetical protein BaOVIS_000250 [Babesia ovis]